MTTFNIPDDVDLEEWGRNNQERLVNVLRHSSDPFARACAWTILDRALADPEIEQLETELQALKKQRGMA